MNQERIAIVGGSGVYDIDGIEYYAAERPETPYGLPSDEIRLGRYAGREVCFLPRHGRGHRYNPTVVPYQANMYALKMLGARWVISISAVGSLREEIAPGHMVVPDQLIDRTKCRPHTMFDPIAVHVSFAHPFCDTLRQVLINACHASGLTVHPQGTLVVMEGPLFSTIAESNLYRSWGASIIGMTALPEAKLARECEMSYATVAMSTDYDCWKDEIVATEKVLEVIHKNVSNVKNLVKQIIPAVPEVNTTPCVNALAGAQLTATEALTPEQRARFELLLGRFWR